MRITCENIAKRYVIADGQRVNAVKNCSGTFEGGQIACIMGVSGSGKSTLLEMLSLNLAPDSGKIYFGRHDVTALGEKEQSRVRNEMIGYVPQSFGLIPILTAEENIRLPSMISGKKEKNNAELFGKLGITDILDRLPDELSGGQKQRVAMARELSGDPAVFLADEPTSALDSANLASVMEMIVRLRDSGCAVIFTTHDTRLCEYADVVYRMTDGVLQIA